MSFTIPRPSRLFVALVLGSLVACSTTTGARFIAPVGAPTRASHPLDQVELIPVGLPDRPFVEIGSLIYRAGITESDASIHAALRRKAAEVGAVAVVDIRPVENWCGTCPRHRDISGTAVVFE